MSVSGLPAWVVEVIKQRKSLDERMCIWRDLTEGCVIPKDRQSGIAVAAGYVAQHLIVGAIFPDDDEDVLDLRRSADPLRDGKRLGVRLASGGRVDVLCKIPMVVLEYLLRQRAQRTGGGYGNNADRAQVLVRVEADDAMSFSVGVFRCLRRRRRHGKARCANALIVCDYERVLRGIQHDRAGRVANRDHSLDRSRTAVEVYHSDGVGMVERDVGDVLGLIDGDRVRLPAIGWTFLTGDCDGQPKVNRLHHLVGLHVDHRDGVAIGIRDQQMLAPDGHAGRV